MTEPPAMPECWPCLPAASRFSSIRQGSCRPRCQRLYIFSLCLISIHGAYRRVGDLCLRVLRLRWPPLRRTTSRLSSAPCSLLYRCCVWRGTTEQEATCSATITNPEDPSSPAVSSSLRFRPWEL